MKFVGKRLFDIFVATFCLILLAPLMLVIALMVKMESEGPVLFKHPRVGKDEKVFRMWKFRTMVKDADKTGPGLTEHDDPRISRLGKYLRRSSLDELPQLINVLKGEMSLVGPRPEIPEIVATYSPAQKRALTIKPGITGLSQINGRDDLKMSEKLNYEVQYVEQRSLLLDLKILVRTPRAILIGRGNRY